LPVVLYDHEAWSQTSKEEYILEIYEKKVLR
jgi:hypothetical protein